MKNIKLLALLFMLGMLFTSCEKQKKSEWSNLYGYTKDDIMGTYTFSNVANAFDEVEGTGRHVCLDAEVSVEPYLTSLVSFTINCPDENFSYTFEGKPTPNNHDHRILMSSGYEHVNGNLRAYNLTGYVLTNDKGDLRLHGFAARNTYKVVDHYYNDSHVYDTILDNGVYYYFDVIKE